MEVESVAWSDSAFMPLFASKRGGVGLRLMLISMLIAHSSRLDVSTMPMVTGAVSVNMEFAAAKTCEAQWGKP